MNESLRAKLRQRLDQPGLVVAPGVFDMVSLRLADTFGFDALYMTGYGTVASHMGLPDAGLATYSDMVGRVTAMAGMAKTPLIADADTGYGGLLNMRHTICGYEAAGAAAIGRRGIARPIMSGVGAGMARPALSAIASRPIFEVIPPRAIFLTSPPFLSARLVPLPPLCS